MSPTPPSSLPADERDLTSAARIRNAALERFAQAGIADTSIRDVAKAAGVSPGLVQHHFKTKDKLRQAVNDHVTASVVAAFADLREIEQADDPIAAAGDRITAFIAGDPVAMRYLGRALADGDPTARQIFDAFVGVIESGIERVARRRALRPDLDLRWAALHLVVFNLATVLFEGAISANLPAPLFDAEQLRRWNVATTELYRDGMFG